MCSCSGSCNCNSTTIPRGPVGPIGPQGIKGNPGTTGSSGDDGDDGLNSFTNLVNEFTQPLNANNTVNSFATINVVDSTWAAINQIIYISFDASNIGGFYRVISKPNNTSLYITRLNWTIPGVTFVAPTLTVSNNSNVTPSGTIGPQGVQGPVSTVAGPQGPQGPQGVAGPNIIDATWGGNTLGLGGLNDKKTSIGVLSSYMTTNDDVLEIQGVFKVAEDVEIDPFTCYLRILDSNTAVGSTIITQFGPIPYTGVVGENGVIEVDCKVQRVGGNRFRVRAKWTISQGGSSLTSYKNTVSDYITDITLDNVIQFPSLPSPLISNTWANNQFIIASADDNSTPAINVPHFEVRSVKRVL